MYKRQISQRLVPRADDRGRVVAMEILNNTYAVANIIRTRKTEQLYTQLQTKTRDVPEERMMPLERSLALLVQRGLVSPLEAEKWANHPSAFAAEIERLGREGQHG